MAQRSGHRAPERRSDPGYLVLPEPIANQTLPRGSTTRRSGLSLRRLGVPICSQHPKVRDGRHPELALAPMCLHGGASIRRHGGASIRRSGTPARSRAIVVPVHVRVRTEADLDACIHLTERVHESDGYPVYFPDGLRPFSASPDAIASWVAEEQGEVVGHVALHRRSTDAVMAMAANALCQPYERMGVIARLLVDPELRREGFRRVLLQTAAESKSAYLSTQCPLRTSC
jgi:GNAT superfamily N-acetyltransferase